MCQLFGLSTPQPMRIRFRWERFASQGAAAGNPDGWGVAYSRDDVQVMREPVPAVDSEMVRFLADQGPLATTVVSHVRRATQGPRVLSNTQPFTRVLGGHTHVFAHNGHVPLAKLPDDPWLQRVGDTDSEAMFCLLLSRLAQLWTTGIPSLKARHEVVLEFAEEMRERGSCNFLYFDGQTLFVHAHRKTLPGHEISSDPGLYMTVRPAKNHRKYHGSIGMDSERQTADQLLVATVPVDDGEWEPLANGTLLRLEGGCLV